MSRRVGDGDVSARALTTPPGLWVFGSDVRMATLPGHDDAFPMGAVYRPSSRSRLAAGSGMSVACSCQCPTVECRRESTSSSHRVALRADAIPRHRQSISCGTNKPRTS